MHIRFFLYTAGTAHCANMYPATETDSSQLVEARVEIQGYIDNWLSQPWLLKEYGLHLLFIVSLAMLVYKQYSRYYARLEQNERILMAYQEQRRRLHTNPNEMFEAFLNRPDENAEN